jgi:hypothetical protein
MAAGAQWARDVAGSPDMPACSSVRRRMEAGDLRQAEAWRAQGRGWQTIARCLLVNETDLRMALGAMPDGSLPARRCDDAPVRPERPDRKGALGLRDLILLAVESGASNLIEVSVQAGAATTSVSTTASLLRADGLMVRKSWRLTPEGQARCVELRRAGVEVEDLAVRHG